MPDAAPAQSVPAEPVITEQPSSDAIAVASALVDAVLAADSAPSPAETRAITPISVPTPQPEVDTMAILLDAAAAEFVPPVEVEPSIAPAVPVATDNGPEPEGSLSTSDSASGTAVTSASSNESVPSIPPSNNSNEGSSDSSPAAAAPGDAANPTTSPDANTSTNAAAANPSVRPRVNVHLSKICRACALDVFYWGAKQWWIKGRANAHTEGTLPRAVRERKDCPEMFQYVKKEGEEGDGELIIGVCPQEDDHCESTCRPVHVY